MNRDAYIAKDPLNKCSFFLSLVEGPNVDGWTQQQNQWLEDVDDDPLILPFKMTAWQVLKQEFRSAFIDYAESERARDQLKKLKMKGGNVDEYIAEFQDLTNRTGSSINDGHGLEMFARGLPFPLATTCINQDNPNTFEEWVHSSQKHQKAWYKIQALKGNYGATQPANKTQSESNRPKQQQGKFFWRQRGQQQMGRNDNTTRQFAPRDPNAMDTSAAVRKATTEKEKQEHRDKGKCFKCSRQGHIACNCPNRQTPVKAKVATDVTTSSSASVASDPPDYTSNAGDAEMTSGNTLADFALKLSVEEREMFVRKMMSEGEDMGFLEA
jgi:hypothetical protein